ncbi:MAG: phage portal protein, partial [Angelakisella sp.]|nr:phage portal protein [Angelakisella sp.]
MILPTGTDLTPADILKIIKKHHGTEKVKLTELENYYNGKHSILKKHIPDDTKPCNKLVYNFPAYIADNFSSYITGNQITYKSKDDITALVDILNYNDAGSQDSLISTDIAIYGKAYEVLYIDADGYTRFQKVNPKEMIMVYDDSLEGNAIYAIRYYLVHNPLNEKQEYNVTVYTNKVISTYVVGQSFGKITPTGISEHYFNDIPVVEYTDKSSFESVISLVDAYEKLSSAEVDDYEAFVDAYLILKGVTAEDEDIAKMKYNRVLMLDDNSNAEYLTKAVNSQQIDSIKNQLVENIHKLSSCPNFADESFGTTSGIAMAYKLLGFTNAGAIRIRNIKKGIQRRLELLCNILALTDNKIDWRDI